MEMMPYHSSGSLGDSASTRVPLPAWGLTTSDWTNGLPVLGDAAFTLRELTIADAPTLFAQLTTDEVSRFISPPPTSVEGFEKFIRWTHTRRAQGRYACFGIVPAGQTHAVGLFQLHLDETDAQTAEWGFVLGQAYWGTGLFVAGARRIVNFAFAAMGLTRLVAHAAVRNGRGNGALRKLGATQSGVRRDAFERHGVRLDQHIWTLTRDRWWGAPLTTRPSARPPTARTCQGVGARYAATVSAVLLVRSHREVASSPTTIKTTTPSRSGHGARLWRGAGRAWVQALASR